MEVSHNSYDIIHDNISKLSGLSSKRSCKESSFVQDSVRSTYAASTSQTTVSILNGDASCNDNTLNMVTSPWSSTTWLPADSISYQDTISVMSPNTYSFSSNSYLKSLNSDITYTSMSVDGVQPQSTTSYGVTSPTIKTQHSRTTVTLLNYAVSPDDTHMIPLFPRTRHGGSTTTSWTLESFTSPGLTISSSNIVRAKYPWSPDSFMSCTDIYPSSLDTLASRKGSRMNMSPSSPNTKLTPMNYVVLSTNLEENPALDWLLAKERSAFNSPKAVDTRV